MNLINIENITKHFTDTPVFDNVSFTLDDNEKVGIVGVNGTGKSTLLKIIAGLEEADSGTITRARNLKLRYLPQSPEFPKGSSALECVMLDNRNELNEWTLESDAKAMLQRLGLPDYEVPAETLSGGQRKRLALANVLLSGADILLLDEPTNHLDSFMADWLEDYLHEFRGALVMVTHDRYFLDSVSNRIVEVDHSKLYSYDTGYLGYLELKQEREDYAQAAERKRKSILRTEIEWMMRGARARSTKQKAHIQRYEALAAVKAPKRDNEIELSSISTRMGKTTVELTDIVKGYGERTLINGFSYNFLKNDRVGFVGENGCGKTTLMKIIAGQIAPDSGSVTVGQTIKLGYYAQEFASSRVIPGNDKDRTETNDEADASGEAASLSYMDPTVKVIDYLKRTAEYVRTSEGLVSASVMLDRFLFPPEKQYTLLGKLSGGEKRRLNLLRVLIEAPNVLILDEPTNDLDIKTLMILEDYLDTFDGIVITVSHDRYFLDRTVRRIFSFEDGEIRQYEGGYTDYINRRKAEDQAREEELQAAGKGGTPESGRTGSGRTGSGKTGGGKASGNTGAAGGKGGSTEPVYSNTHETKLKFSYKEQREFDTIDDDIAALEQSIEDTEAEMAQCTTDFVRLNELSAKKDSLQAQLDEKMERWMYLNELYEQICAQNS